MSGVLGSVLGAIGAIGAIGAASSGLGALSVGASGHLRSRTMSLRHI
jgi:hypothetical protein